MGSQIVVSYDIVGREELVAGLERLAGPELRSLSRRIVRDQMAPILEAAKAEVPVESGRIQASLGELTSSSRGSATAKVGTRRDFVWQGENGMLVHGRLKGKRADSAYQRGASKDVKTAQQYASVIHFGSDSKGRIRRAAGPAPFLDQPMTTRESTIVDNVAGEFRRYVETH